MATDEATEKSKESDAALELKPPLKKAKTLLEKSDGYETSNGDVKCVFSAMPEPPSPSGTNSDQTEPFEVAETEVDVESKPGLIESIDVSGEKSRSEAEETETKSTLSDVIVEKCLRSRKIPFRIVEGENGDTTRLGSVESKVNAVASSEKKERKQKVTSFFIGEPVPEIEARERWGWRYDLKSQRSKRQNWKLNAGEEDEIILNVECHYTQAKVDSCIFNLGDCAHIKSYKRDGGTIFSFATCLLNYGPSKRGRGAAGNKGGIRAVVKVMKEEAAFHDKKRLFYSTLLNDNLLDCIISKVSVIQIAPTLGLQPYSVPPSDFYYDMEYCVEYSTFRTLMTNESVQSYDLPTSDDIEAFRSLITATPLGDKPSCEPYKAELALLDLYSGCGGMSTGLCLGAKLSSVNLVTRWAVDADRSACDSLELNHPETQVRNETAEDFLELLKGWEKLCQWYVFNNLDRPFKYRAEAKREVKSNVNSPSDVKIASGEYEVLRLGDVDVLCGGPPCQGISGYNRFRNVDAPLDDERNRQIVFFMDIVKFLRPKYVLMENVADILRFDKGSLARYALSRLVHMNYQARLGTIAAGCYGLPQFRLRVFLWGALPTEKLPQFPLPTHDVVVRYGSPSEFERNIVAYDAGEPRELEEAVLLHDAISDLPAVTNHETREQITYEMPPETEFQKYIRLTKDGNKIIF
ncbi:hypothetical protein CsSME_00049618 [Camellia sinensis var. sinensis]